MARVTVEDCVQKVPNRFELVMVSAQRARRIGTGAPLTVDRDNDKNPVVSLREVAESKVSVEDLKEDLIRSHQRVFAVEEETSWKKCKAKKNGTPLLLKSMKTTLLTGLLMTMKMTMPQLTISLDLARTTRTTNSPCTGVRL